MKKLKFYHFSGIVALIIAACSAAFSVYGLSVLFGSAKLASIILFSALEIGKIVSVTILYNYAKKIPAIARKYFPYAILVLMLITSLGVGGFLTNSYQKSSDSIATTTTAQSANTDQQNLILEEINNYKQQITDDTARKDTLNSQRTKQEERLNQAQAALNRRMQTEARSDIKLSNEEISTVGKRITDTYALIAKKNEALRVLKEESFKIKAEDRKQEVGPLRYLSKLFSINMDVIVIFLILTIIFVFDPLAIILWLSTNAIANLEKKTPKLRSANAAPEKPFGKILQEEFEKFKKEKKK